MKVKNIIEKKNIIKQDNNAIFKEKIFSEEQEEEIKINN